jgi:aspartate carbamoyltransferase catalytic subunit
VSKGESLRDTVLTIDAMGVDMMIVRHPASGAPQQIADWVGCSVVNAGDGTHEHPSQALLDAYTMRRALGDLRGRHVAIVGDLTHSRVLRSNLLCLDKLGAQVTLVAPPTLMPSGIGSWAVNDGFATSYDLDAVLPKVDAVMMLRVQRERMSGGYFPTAKEYAVTYGLTGRRLGLLQDHAVICHPGPMNRGLEISADAADAARSLVLDQVSAGVAVRMSILYHLLAGEGSDQ